jgi:hypothetical protein
LGPLNETEWEGFFQGMLQPSERDRCWRRAA